MASKKFQPPISLSADTRRCSASAAVAESSSFPSTMGGHGDAPGPVDSPDLFSISPHPEEEEDSASQIEVSSVLSQSFFDDFGAGAASADDDSALMDLDVVPDSESLADLIKDSADGDLTLDLFSQSFFDDVPGVESLQPPPPEESNTAPNSTVAEETPVIAIKSKPLPTTITEINPKKTAKKKESKKESRKKPPKKTAKKNKTTKPAEVEEANMHPNPIREHQVDKTTKGAEKKAKKIPKNKKSQEPAKNPLNPVGKHQVGKSTAGPKTKATPKKAKNTKPVHIEEATRPPNPIGENHVDTPMAGPEESPKTTSKKGGAKKPPRETKSARPRASMKGRKRKPEDRPSVQYFLASCLVHSRRERPIKLRVKPEDFASADLIYWV